MLSATAAFVVVNVVSTTLGSYLNNWMTLGRLFAFVILPQIAAFIPLHQHLTYTQSDVIQLIWTGLIVFVSNVVCQLLFNGNSPFTLFLPDRVQQWFANYHYPYCTQGKQYFDPDVEFELVKTVHKCNTEDEILSVIKEFPYTPVLFKNVYSQLKIEDFTKQFKEVTAGKEFPCFDLRPLKGFGSFHTTGKDMTDEQWKQNFKHVHANNMMDDVWDNKIPDIYFTFVPVWEGKLGDILGFTSRFSLADTSFIGNMSREAMTTALHSNWASDTLSIQLNGYKKWLIASPFEMKELLMKQNKGHTYASPKGGVLYPGFELTLEVQKTFKMALVEPGDVLYFPPYAPHAVISGKGLNVMTAIRFVDLTALIKSITIYPMMTLDKLTEVGSKHVMSMCNRLLGLHDKSPQSFRKPWNTNHYDPFYTTVAVNFGGTPYSDEGLEALMQRVRT